MSALTVRLAHELDVCPEEKRWLIEGLWAREAVGIVGGEPKCGKSFLALAMAVAVASGTPCLQRFATAKPGRVLLFAAEDSLAIVRERLSGIAAAADLALDRLDIHVIVDPVVRLDIERDRARLEQTVQNLSPTLLVLDPFVRLHRIDENLSADVAPLLDYLRGLQRRHKLAVVLVHHARKGAAHIRAGQALRGSSELHAWGDSNLYLRRSTNDQLSLSIEHRAAPSIDGLALHLHTDGKSLGLRVSDSPPAPVAMTETLSPIDRVLRVLTDATKPLTHREIRDLAKIRAARVGDALASAVADARVVKIDGRYQLVRP